MFMLQGGDPPEEILHRKSSRGDNKMKYLGVLLSWCLVNFPIFFIGFDLGANMSYLTLYFLAGVFFILLFAFAEFVKEVKEVFEELEYKRR